tara:strand:- start:203 stop:412 length:210 start_codon:yes stop_codon:yes gene_type:complete
MQIGDLVVLRGLRSYQQRMRAQNGSIGIIVSRHPDADPNYYCWYVSFGSDPVPEPFHESYLNVISKKLE